VGKPGLLDALIQMDLRFVLVLGVAWYLYFRPSLQLSSQASLAGDSILNRTWTVSYDAPKGLDSTRLCVALVAAMVVWLAVGVATLLAQSVHWPLVHDAPIMHYIAWRIAEGATPYRDLLDMNMPGVYLIHLAVLKVFGPSDLGWRAFDLIWLALTNVLLWRLCYPVAQQWSWIALVLYSGFHLSNGPPGMGQRDYLEFAFLLGGLVLTVEALGHKLDRRRLACAGFLLGCAMCVKPFAGLLWVSLAVWSFLKGREHAGGRWTSPSVVLGAGLLAPIALALWLASVGALASFLEAVVGVMPVYSRMHDRPFLNYVWDYWPLLALCLLTIPAAMAASKRHPRRIALSMGVIYGLLHYGLQNKGWLYQLYPLIGFASALLACAVGEAFTSKPRGPILGVSVLSIGFIVAIGQWDSRLRPAMSLTADRIGTVSALQQDVEPRLSEGSTIQVFDTTGGCLHALLRMRAAQATRYIGDYLLFDQVDQPYVQRLHLQLMAELRKNPPTYFVVYRWGWPSGQYERLRRFPKLEQFIAQSYHVEKVRSQYVLYARGPR